MILEVQIPSKTFLVGEYGVLHGGTALIAATSPVFVLQVQRGEGTAAGLHPESPAGMFLREHRALFGKLDVRFVDPYGGRGGFGASGAQFLRVWLLRQHLQDSRDALFEAFGDYKKILAYKQDLSSGADILAQAVGGLALVKTAELTARHQRWPFDGDGGFAIFRTGIKVKTHEHLRTLGNIATADLMDPAAAAEKALLAGDWPLFLLAVGEFARGLEVLGLVAPTTAPLLKRLREQSCVATAKGCGSLGADTVVVFFARENEAQVMRLAAELKLEFVAGDRELCAGALLGQRPFGRPEEVWHG
jgi:mevalonate kinase